VIEFFGFLLLGCGGIWAAYHYTAGDRPYGYRGWGDVSVFIFFGIIAVLGTHVLIYHAWNWAIVFLAFMQGALSSMVLHLNNMRDFEDDQHAGKITLALKLGWKNSIAYFIILGGLSFILLLTFLIINKSNLSYFSLLPWLLLFGLMNKVRKANGETKLDGDLKKVALSSFFIALCLFLTSIS
jgi:1,4-dihydroxy-2-naphthoate octaprenyltransferase